MKLWCADGKWYAASDLVDERGYTTTRTGSGPDPAGACYELARHLEEWIDYHTDRLSLPR
jgi:hypothetical protein